MNEGSSHLVLHVLFRPQLKTSGFIFPSMERFQPPFFFYKINWKFRWSFRFKLRWHQPVQSAFISNEKPTWTGVNASFGLLLSKPSWSHVTTQVSTTVFGLCVQIKHPLNAAGLKIIPGVLSGPSVHFREIEFKGSYNSNFCIIWDNFWLFDHKLKRLWHSLL